ncbi:MAG: hypothetical protein LBN02_09190 [Oscillospiraceae bacterium]|jgi:hypothetical protein|nr:hypothetical protein [Oscillospiraceae bacterium]
MKKAKFITGAVLILVTLIVAGEIYTWHLSSFSQTGYTGVQLYAAPDDTRESMLADIAVAAEENGVGVFCVDRKSVNMFAERLNIYATDIAASSLTHRAQIREGTFAGLVIGSTEVKILPFGDAPELSTLTEGDTVYVVGTSAQIRAFCGDTAADYGANTPRMFLNGRDTEKIYVAAVWIIVLILLLLLTQFEIDLLKKEVAVRLIYGESLRDIIARNLITDAAVFVAMPTVLMFALSPLTNTFYAVDAAMIALGAFLLLNSASHLRLYAVDYKRDIATRAGAKGTLRSAYAFKVVTVILAVAILAGNIGMISGALSFRGLRGFFEERADYAYVNIWDSSMFDHETGDIDDSVVREFHRRASLAGDTLALVYLGNWILGGIEYVYADSGAAEYLQSEIPELRGATLENKVYFIVPEKYAERADVADEMREVWWGYSELSAYPNGETYAQDDFDVAVVPYRRANIVAMTRDETVRGGRVPSPIIIFNNTDKQGYNDYIQQSTMYRVTETEFRAFLAEMSVGGTMSHRTGALDNYDYQWQVEKKTLIVAVVMLALILALESVVIRTILKFEYRVYAAELALKKVYGHTLFARHRKIILTTAILGIVSLVGSLIVCRLLKSAALVNVAIGGVILLAIEQAFIAASIRRVERRNIQRILKGEAV